MDERTTLTDTLEVTGVASPREDAVTLKGEFYWRLFDQNDATIEEGHVDNLVVNAGRAFLAARCIANGKPPISHLAVGSSTTPAGLGNIALAAETARVALANSTSAGAVVSCSAVVPAGVGTGTVEEVGLFNSGLAGDMISRALTGTITKPAGLGLQFAWTLTVN